MALWRRQCALSALADEDIAAALAENLEAQAALERERLQLVAEEVELRKRLAACQLTTEPPHVARLLVDDSQPPPTVIKTSRAQSCGQAVAPHVAQRLVCSHCGASGKDQFSNAQRKKVAHHRRCKRCVLSPEGMLHEVPDEGSPPTLAAGCSSESTAASEPGPAAGGPPLVACAPLPAAAMTEVDPRRLPSWVPAQGHGVGGGGGASALLCCFEQAIAPNARAVLASNRELIREMPAWIQWCHSCATIAAHFEQRSPLCRFALQQPSRLLPKGGRRECGGAPCASIPGPDSFGLGDIFIDVMAPARACLAPCLAPGLGASQGDGAEAGAPLHPFLLVRYLHAATADEYRSRRDAFAGSKPGQCAWLEAALQAKWASAVPPAAGEGAGAWAREWARAFALQGEEELEVALTCLRNNEAALSHEYRAHFYGQSRWHSEVRGFRCSFIVPPVPAEKLKSVRV